MNRGLPKDIQARLDILEPALQEAFLQAVTDIKNAAQLGIVIGHIEAGRIDQAIIALRLDQGFFDPVARMVGDAYVQGGRAAVADLPKIVDPFSGGRFVFAFDSRGPRAEQWVQRKSSGMIVDILQDQRELVRSVILKGVTEGRNPRNVALDIVGRIDKATGKREGGLIGITSHQAGYVDNARAELAALDKGYFTRTRRDKRYDATVLKSIKDGKPLPATVIDKITGRYADRLLLLRAETIARTEALNAMRAGMDEAHSQLVESGKIDDDQIERIWDATNDGRTRHDHKAMDGQKVGKHEPFVAPDGSRMMFPGDTSFGASAAQVVNCRCTVRTKINYFKGLT